MDFQSQIIKQKSAKLDFNSYYYYHLKEDIKAYKKWRQMAINGKYKPKKNWEKMLDKYDIDPSTIL